MLSIISTKPRVQLGACCNLKVARASSKDGGMMAFL